MAVFRTIAHPGLGRSQANALILFAAFLWGAGNVAQHTVLADVGPITAVGLRCALAALALLPFALSARGRRPGPSRLLSAMTILSFAIAVTLLQAAYGHTTVTNASFLVNTATIMTPLIAWFLYRLKPRREVWIAALLALAGAWLMGGAHWSALNPGDGLCLLSAAFYGLWMVNLGRCLAEGADAIRLMAVTFAVTALITLALGLPMEPLTSDSLGRALPELLFLGLCATGLAYSLQAIAQTRTSASEAAVLATAEAPFGAMGGMLVLGESLNFAGAAGAALILSAVFVIAWPRNRLEDIT